MIKKYEIVNRFRVKLRLETTLIHICEFVIKWGLFFGRHICDAKYKVLGSRLWY